MKATVTAALLSAFTLLSAEPAHAAEPDCAALAALLPAGRTCVDAPRGIVISSSAARGAELARLADSGERRFAARFARPVPRYAVVEGDGVARDGALDTALERAGIAWRLPWLSPVAMADAYRASITRAVTTQAQAMGFDATRTAAMVTAALAQQESRWSPDASREREGGTLPHELGHGWFIRAFWPATTARSGDHYGGPAPDWMDETAAVLMEDDGMADKRRAQFARTYRGTDAAARARLLDLTTFLSGGHPALPKLAGVGGGAGGGAGVRVLTGAEAAGVAAVAGGFYLQARLFADYVLARSGDPAAFRTAADAFARGATTPQWLAANAAALKLPATLPALEADWHAWLATHVPASAS